MYYKLDNLIIDLTILKLAIFQKYVGIYYFSMDPSLIITLLGNKIHLENHFRPHHHELFLFNFIIYKTIIGYRF